MLDVLIVCADGATGATVYSNSAHSWSRNYIRGVLGVDVFYTTSFNSNHYSRVGYVKGTPVGVPVHGENIGSNLC